MRLDAPVRLPRRGTAGPARAGRPAVAGVVALAGSLCFVLLRLWLAAGGNITKLVRAARPFSHPGQVPRGLFVFPLNG